MHSLRHPLAAILLFLSVLAAVPGTLHAQATKLFVASYGSDSNAGTSVSPKRTFQAAHDAVAAAGEIVALDTAGYGLLTITKSVTITVPSGVNAFITAPTNTHAISVNAGSSDVVVLRGLILEGADTTTGSGIYAAGVGELEVSDCKVRNFYYGIALAATTTGTTLRLVARRCDVRDVGRGFIISTPNSNTFPGYGVDAILSDCTVDHANDSAVYVTSESTAAIYLTLTRCALTNGGTAVNLGTVAVGYLDGCNLSGNTTGIAVNSSSVNYTRGNNAFSNNGTDGTFTATQALK